MNMNHEITRFLFEVLNPNLLDKFLPVFYLRY
jgi:hypothetical protein